MNLLIVGINPSSGKPRKLSAVSRLERWVNLLDVKYYGFANVIPEPGSYHINKVDFDYVKSFCSGHNKIIALGGFVSEVLRRIDIEHYKLSHPSPLNRKLNDKNFEDKCIIECKRYLKYGK